MKVCGSCTECCTVIPVKELQKAQFTRCAKLHSIPHKDGPGCGIYPVRPVSCRMWKCVWLRTPEMPDEYRPDRVGFIIDEVKDLIAINGKEMVAAQIWAAPGSEDAWCEEAAHRCIQALLEQRHCKAVLWRQRDMMCRAFYFGEGGGIIVTEPNPVKENFATILGDEEERARKLRRLTGVER